MREGGRDFFIPDFIFFNEEFVSIGFLVWGCGCVSSPVAAFKEVVYRSGKEKERREI